MTGQSRTWNSPLRSSYVNTMEYIQQQANYIRLAISQQQSVPSALALVEGGPLPDDPAVGTTLPQMLHKAAEQCAGKGIIYLQPDGTETCQSYVQLLEEAQKIRGSLRQQGLQSHDRVILQLENNWDIIPAFWGCILGGFAPVIMEVPPSYEASQRIADKLRQIWQLLGCPLIITREKQQAQIQDFLPQSGPGVSSLESLRNNQPDSSPDLSQPDEVAFLSLTSGSTGIPKCVQLTHRNLIARARGSNLLNDYHPENIIFNWLPLYHTASITVYHTRCVVLGCQQIHAPKEYVLGRILNWFDAIDRHRVTHSWAPNFAYALAHDALKKEPQQSWDMSCVQSLMNWGEAVSFQTVTDFLESMVTYGLSPATVRPGFGMTEVGAITYCQPTLATPLIFHSMDRFSLTEKIHWVEVEQPNSSIFADLGSLIPGVTIRVVDRENSVLPENTIGRLQVCGNNVSPGYYNNPEANVEAFLEDGWFETGDLGFISDGHLVVTGRVKEMLIINGANYYSKAIEMAVETVQGVEVSYTAACAVRDGQGATDKLAIFFHGQTTKNSDLLDLLQNIRQQTISKAGINPDYLIPVPREAIPKTGIGKIQRLELSRRFEAGEFQPILEQLTILLENENNQRHAGKIAPRTPLEKQLTSIWQELLDVNSVGIEDNFFELGGNSVVAVMVVHKLQDKVNQIVHPVALFEAPTIAQLAVYIQEKYLESAKETAGKADSTTIQKLTEKLTTDLSPKELPLTIEQEYMWYRFDPVGVYNNVWQIWRIEGKLNLNLLQDAISEMARRHTPLHTTFQEIEGSLVQVVRPEMEPTFEVIDYSDIPDNADSPSVGKQIEQLAMRPFDLENGPIVRVNILRLRETSHILILCIHHMAIDGWSMGILLRELKALYSAFASGQLSPLPQLSMTYTDFVQWYQQWLDSGVSETNLNYWQKNLMGAEFLELPYDRSLPSNPTLHRGTERLHISPDLKNNIENISAQFGVVPFVTLLAAYSIVLGNFAAQENFVIDTIFANRPIAEAQPLVGNFINSLPIRLNLQGNPTFAELLARVNPTFRSAYTHSYLPFRQLVDIWEAQGKPFRPSAPCFNFINAIPEPLDIPDLHISSIEIDNTVMFTNLFLAVLPIDGGYLAQFWYMSEAFNRATVIRIVRQFHHLLESVATNPQIPLSELRLTLNQVLR